MIQVCISMNGACPPLSICNKFRIIIYSYSQFVTNHSDNEFVTKINACFTEYGGIYGDIQRLGQTLSEKNPQLRDQVQQLPPPTTVDQNTPLNHRMGM